MNQLSRNKLLRAWRLLLSGVTDWVTSDALLGRAQRVVNRIRHNPALDSAATYFKVNVPLWKQRYK